MQSNEYKGTQNQAPTIEHTEIHVDLKRKGEHPTINTGSHTVQYYNTSDPGQPTIIVQTKPDPKDKPKDYVVTSCFVILLCNFAFGLLGWHYGLKANYAWQLGDEVESRAKAKKAKICVIVGILVGIATYVLALALFFTLSPLAPGRH
ncbi:hypothetical protein ACJMK2_016002 [Sinanodonta woodiana]|uniref:Interferon-induced transmembrane protein n=1 Tax=Sinanodonta woodiana TaxID=1069815 RepID=A0ABD3US77_SINWO